MPQAPIPFIPDQQSGWSVRAGASPMAVNVVIDGRGAVRRRPGITFYENMPNDGESGLPVFGTNTTPIVGLHVALNDDLYAVDSRTPGRHIYRVTKLPFPEFEDLSIDPTDQSLILDKALVGDGRPVFAETEAALFIAGGDALELVELATAKPRRVGGGPPKASHVIANASRILVNDVSSTTGRGSVFFSAPGSGSAGVPSGHETWLPAVGAGSLTAEARPDRVRGLFENTNEVFVYGDTTLQVFGSDPTFIYSPLPARNHGLAGAYGAIEVDQKLAFLDHRRRFCITDARGLDFIGEPIQSTLDDMETVTDVFGFRVRTNVLDCLCWHFPTDGRTFCYQINTEGPAWSLWQGWDTATNNWKPLAISSHTHRHATGDNLVGLTDGRIGVLSMDSLTDFGQPINAYVETGFQDYGTDRRKHCVSVRLELKRGEVVGPTAPIAFLKWRDRPGAWEGENAIDLGASGDREINVEFRSLGVFRRRQWMFEFAGNVDLELTRATIEYEILSN